MYGRPAWGSPGGSKFSVGLPVETYRRMVLRSFIRKVDSFGGVGWGDAVAHRNKKRFENFVYIGEHDVKFREDHVRSVGSHESEIWLFYDTAEVQTSHEIVPTLGDPVRNNC